MVATQIVLGREGQTPDVLQTADAAARDIVQFEVVPIEMDLGDPLHQVAQALELERLQLWARQGLGGVPDAVFDLEAGGRHESLPSEDRLSANEHKSLNGGSRAMAVSHGSDPRSGSAVFKDD